MQDGVFYFTMEHIPHKEILELLTANRNKSIIITAHKNPDGDAVGSTLGWFHILLNAGYNATVILPDNFPDSLAWMPDAKGILLFENQKEKCTELLNNAGIIFCLDYNGLSRTGEMENFIRQSSAPKIMIDHHPLPENEFTIVFSHVPASSTSEMVVALAQSLGWTEMITEEAASCLYAGIMTDTGSFRFSSTSAQTHEAAALLIRSGAKNSEIHNLVFDTNSEQRMRLLGFALSEKLKVVKELRTAYITLSNEELRRFNFKKGDTEGMVNYGLAIEGIDVAVLFTEHPDMVRISFRSKGNIPVNKLSSAWFSGGGHMNAAGGKSDDKLDVTVERFLRYLPEFMAPYV
jgi:bifunctional oligoribonuclease and PAP phosphatase NrnA